MARGAAERPEWRCHIWFVKTRMGAGRGTTRVGRPEGKDEELTRIDEP